MDADTIVRYSGEGRTREAASRALATRRYTGLAALAAARVSAPAVLDTSAPLRAIGRDSELVTVAFAPASREFVAATAEGEEVREVFRGLSLPLACSAANQALEGLAPLPSAVRAPKIVHSPNASRLRAGRPLRGGAQTAG